MAGLFITFEGIEGCGKTTQIRILEDYLKTQGHEVALTREPGGTIIGDQIRVVLLKPENMKMHGITELFLYAAARAQHVEEFIRPALESGKIVLCDRFFDATSAYQGFARSIDRRFLANIHELATGNLIPDLTILLDCPAETGLRRALDRNLQSAELEAEGRFEQEAINFHEKVREGYLTIAREEPKRVKIINATDDIETIREKIITEVNKVL
ncbi:dTMP kinase [bacterium]|nr:dTMP kinase [bacterium]